MITVRGESPATLKTEEVLQFIEWADFARRRTSFDVNIIGYPRCAVFIAENGNGPIAYLPCQTALMAEVFLPKPDSSRLERAASLGAFDKALQVLGRNMGIGDIYTYVPYTESDYANKIGRHGWLEIGDVRLFKKPTQKKGG